MKNTFAFVLILIGIFVLVQPAPITVVGQDDQLEYIGASKCKMCHNRKSTGKYYDNWETTAHAKAFDLLKGDEQKNPECLQCHTTGYGEPGGFKLDDPKLVKAMQGVQCEICHGQGSAHRKSKKDNVIANKGIPKADTCVKCHNEKSPNWNPEKYTKADGTKTGFDFEQAVKKINHKAVRDAIGK